jgi:ParB family chromosome partitioning protein
MNGNQLAVTYIPLEEIDDSSKFNCRGKIAPIDVVDLSKDIAERGLIQPVSVMCLDNAQRMEVGKSYRLLAGFRRFMAHKVNDAKEIACLISEIDNEIDALTFNLAENIQRKDLNVLQEALAIKRLRDLGVPETEASLKTGMSRGWIQVRFMLLGLPEEVQQEAAVGIISQDNIRKLYTLYHKTGDKEQLFEQVRRLKDAKARGVSIKVETDKAKARQQKVLRKKGEIGNMMGHMKETIGNGLHTRCMAWCAGEISDEDLYYSIKIYATENDKLYTIPS